MAIIDLIMPKMNGEELLRQLHQQGPELPVIIVTGVKDVSTGVRCVKASSLPDLRVMNTGYLQNLQKCSSAFCRFCRCREKKLLDVDDSSGNN